jgi:hypothetical protein
MPRPFSYRALAQTFTVAVSAAEQTMDTAT